MFRIIIYFIILLLGFSCTKDRIIPQEPTIIDGELAVINFWDFNTTNPSDILIPSESVTKGELTYFGNEIQLEYCDGGNQSCWETVNDGTDLNALETTVSGRALRLRNPADELIISSSTAGFYDIETSFAVKRTGSGAQTLHLFYTTDGSNFGYAGLEENVFTVTEDYQLIELDLTNIAAANNNPQFKLKIVFKDGNNNNSGNTRFDNLLITGKSL